MKTFKRIICIAFVLALCLSMLALPVSASGDSKALAEAKKGVVQILAIAYSGDKTSGKPVAAGSGTGFAVGEAGKDSNVFITNWHVATCDGYAPSQVRVYLLLDNWYLDKNDVPQNAVECEILYSTHDNGGVPDYAILRATEKITGFKALPLCHSDDIPSGSPVYALGYPGVITDLNSTTGAGIDDITITSGVVSQHMDMDMGASQKVSVLVHDAQLSGGNSGGPLVDSKGQVVGINTYNLKKNEAYSVAVSTEYITERLDLLGLPYTLKGGSGLDTNMVLYIVLGIVIVAAVVVIVVVLTKGKKKAKAGSLWLKAPNGSMIAITAAPMEIGRNPNCQVRMPDDTKGVSRRHCTVQLKDGMVLLTDIGSSGGTFVGGSRIGVNMPVAIAKGASFCLGSATSNKFTIC